MRCQFCGWDNPQGKETCEKCNKPLSSSANETVLSHAPYVESQSRPTDRQPVAAFNPKATVRENQAPEAVMANREEDSKCPVCGYDLEDGVCSACGYTANEKEKQVVEHKEVSDVKKTMRPIRKGEKEGTFTLTPISEENGMPEGSAITFEGNETTLNRDNTDPKNQTITSVRQAEVTYEDGKWSIEDKSEYKTTFVQASRKIELQSGDLILLGNQLYRFES